MNVEVFIGTDVDTVWSRLMEATHGLSWHSVKLRRGMKHIKYGMPQWNSVPSRPRVIPIDATIYPEPDADGVIHLAPGMDLFEHGSIVVTRLINDRTQVCLTGDEIEYPPLAETLHTMCKLWPEVIAQLPDDLARSLLVIAKETPALAGGRRDGMLNGVYVDQSADFVQTGLERFTQDSAEWRHRGSDGKERQLGKFRWPMRLRVLDPVSAVRRGYPVTKGPAPDERRIGAADGVVTDSADSDESTALLNPPLKLGPAWTKTDQGSRARALPEGEAPEPATPMPVKEAVRVDLYPVGATRTEVTWSVADGFGAYMNLVLDRMEDAWLEVGHQLRKGDMIDKSPHESGSLSALDDKLIIGTDAENLVQIIERLTRESWGWVANADAYGAPFSGATVSLAQATIRHDGNRITLTFEGLMRPPPGGSVPGPGDAGPDIIRSMGTAVSFEIMRLAADRAQLHFWARPVFDRYLAKVIAELAELYSEVRDRPDDRALSAPAEAAPPQVGTPAKRDGGNKSHWSDEAKTAYVAEYRRMKGGHTRYRPFMQSRDTRLPGFESFDIPSAQQVERWARKFPPPK